jgi:hypothetical protein
VWIAKHTLLPEKHTLLPDRKAYPAANHLDKKL